MKFQGVIKIFSSSYLNINLIPIFIKFNFFIKNKIFEKVEIILLSYFGFGLSICPTIILSKLYRFLILIKLFLLLETEIHILQFF